nr:immunoglobulin light chain junction region [Macaca mulatta]
CQQHYSYSFTF